MNEIERYVPEEPHEVLRPALPVNDGHQYFPADVAAFEKILRETLDDAHDVGHQADGAFGAFGMVAVTTIIPIIGGLYSAYAGMRLYSCARRIQCSGKLRRRCLGLTSLVVVIGEIPLAGDLVVAFFKAHAMQTRMIRDEVNLKLEAIEIARRQGERNGSISRQEMKELQNLLFRSGRSKFSHRLIGVIKLVILFFLAIAVADVLTAAFR